MLTRTVLGSIHRKIFLYSYPIQRTLSDLLPGLSADQIRRIGETDTYLRGRHLLIEGEMTAAERDVARVRDFSVLSIVPNYKHDYPTTHKSVYQYFCMHIRINQLEKTNDLSK